MAQETYYNIVAATGAQFVGKDQFGGRTADLFETEDGAEQFAAEQGQEGCRVVPVQPYSN